MQQDDFARDIDEGPSLSQRGENRFDQSMNDMNESRMTAPIPASQHEIDYL